MGVTLPSQATDWIELYGEQLTESEEYSTAGEGWGVGFNGDFLFDIQPDDVYDGDPLYFYLALEDGVCHDAYVTEDPATEDWGFAFRGKYSDWKGLVYGDVDPVEGLMSGTFDLDGDMQKVMQYSQAAIVMTEAAADIDTEFEY
jgi:putative sterol carrier protein